MDFKILAAGVLFLLKIAIGLWLMKTGRPYNTIFLTLHKLIALGTLVMIGAIVRPLLRTDSPSTLEMIGLAATGLFFLAAIATGGIISAKKASRTADVIHKLASGLALLCAAGTVYFLFAV